MSRWTVLLLMLIMSPARSDAAQWLLVNASLFSDTPRAVDLRSSNQVLVDDLAFGGTALFSAAGAGEWILRDSETQTVLASINTATSDGGILIAHGGINDRPLELQLLDTPADCGAAEYCSQVIHFAPVPRPNTGADSGIGFQLQCLPAISQAAGLQIDRLTYGDATDISGPFIPGAQCDLSDVAVDGGTLAWPDRYSAGATAATTTRFLLIGDGTVTPPGVITLIGKTPVPNLEFAPPFVSSPDAPASQHYREADRAGSGLLLQTDDAGTMAIQYFHDSEGNPRWTLIRLTEVAGGYAGTQFWPVQDNGQVRYETMADVVIEVTDSRLIMTIASTGGSDAPLEYVPVTRLPR